MSTIEALLLFSIGVTGALGLVYTAITGYYRVRTWLWLRQAKREHQDWLWDNLDCENGTEQKQLGACEETLSESSPDCGESDCPACSDIPDLTDEAKEIPDKIVDEDVEKSGLGHFAVRSDQVDAAIEKLKGESALAEVTIKDSDAGLPVVGLDSADNWWEIWEEPVSDKVEKLERTPRRTKKAGKKTKSKSKGKGKRKSRK